MADARKFGSIGEKGGDIGKMSPTESRNAAGEYPCFTAHNNQRKYFNDQVTFKASDEQITAIIKLFYYIYITNKNTFTERG